MKSSSRYAIATALGLALAVMAPSSPLMAKKEDKAAAAAAAAQPKLGDAVRKALAPAEAAIKNKDLAGADAAIAAGRAVATTPDEKFVVAQFGISAAQITGDQTRLGAALDELISTGEAANRLSQADKAKYYWVQGQLAFNGKNYPKAEQAITNAIANGAIEADAPAILAESQLRNGKRAEAVATLIKAIDQRAATGQPVPSEWFARGADVSSQAKLPAEFVRITSAWLTAYPVRQNWHDSLFIYRQLTNPAGDLDLGLLRLARAAGVLPLAAQANYLDYAQAVYLKFPNEAVDVLNEGITAGKLNPATSQNTREILALSKAKVAADKASIPSAVASATGPKGTFKSAITTGDLLYGYKDYAKAADLYKAALAKPGADAGQANYNLGLALAQAGDKAGAKAALNAVTSGPYAPLATYAKVWIDHPAAS